jgi:hypothetical protein
VLPIHPAAELFPPMAPDELKALGEDIKKNGLTSPIAIVTRDAKRWHYQLLDGRNPLDAMELVGVPFNLTLRLGGCRIDWNETVYTLRVIDSDPYVYVISANIHRRHLTAEQKRELIAELIKATPEKSDRQIAETVKASPTTVGTVRREVVSPTVQSGQLPPKRIGKDGKVRKVANKPNQKVLSTPPKVSPAPAQNRDNIGSESNGENARLRAQIDELQASVRQRDIRITGFDSEIDEVKMAAQRAVEHSLARQIEELIDKHGVSMEDFLSDAIDQYARKTLADLGEKYAKEGITNTPDEEEERWLLACALAVLEMLGDITEDEQADENKQSTPPSADDGLDIPPSLRRAAP